MGNGIEPPIRPLGSSDSATVDEVHVADRRVARWSALTVGIADVGATLLTPRTWTKIRRMRHLGMLDDT